MPNAQVPSIHPTAIISPEAELADDVVVGPYVVIEGAVRIGPGCVLRPHVHLCGPLAMGRGNKVFAGSVLGERMWYRLHGYDVEDPPTKQSGISHSRTLDPASRTPDKAWLMARKLAIKAASRMRRELCDRTTSTALPCDWARRKERREPRAGSKRSGWFHRRRKTSWVTSSASEELLRTRRASP